MCRLIGAVSRHRAPVADLLGDDLDPFIRLACEHKDGWGLAFRQEDGTIGILRGIDRADDSDRLQHALKHQLTDMAVLHIRMASPNLAVTVNNTHPFGDARAAFAHNGEIRPVAALEKLIDPDLLATAAGTTDSERYYLAVRERMNRGVTPGDAITLTAQAITQSSDLVVSLNAMMLTPTGLYAYAQHDPHSEVIGRRGPAYFGLSYRQEEDLVVVASEGWPQPAGRWAALPDGEVAEFPALHP
ncbi:class II glutamine amidotransferase [Kineosporia succinea]|uniref:Glutamine amidotransferase n=1 Tax=Kineosporia succinea TaxID=84632 RepID=A0ABT9P4Z4_9ACTN|nr:class II glutamine amidotransferase [Kineosporia succinea]MDP9827757.1 putative glutamine amidotransferase [Kineosporia succinea]